MAKLCGWSQHVTHHDRLLGLAQARGCTLLAVQARVHEASQACDAGAGTMLLQAALPVQR